MIMFNLHRLTLAFRDRKRIERQSPNGSRLKFVIFPFTSESIRMGIVVCDAQTDITFLQKDADAAMSKIIQRNDWLEEETVNMAREDLRTLVISRRN